MRFVTIFFVIIFLAMPVLAETVFFETLPDIPVASGLEVLPSEGVSFDKPEGRIAESVAVMARDGDHPGEYAIMQYYNKVLPSFGWIDVGENRYMRGEEVLKFWFAAEGNDIYFHILIKPADSF